MMVPAALLLLGALTAVVAPRLLARADWPDREPVVALWVWQCVVAAVLLCCVLSMTLSAARRLAGGARPCLRPRAARRRRGVRARAPTARGRAATAVALALRRGVDARRCWSGRSSGRGPRRRQRRAELLVRAPLLPGEEPGAGAAGGAGGRAARRLVAARAPPRSWSSPRPRCAASRAGSWTPSLAHEQGHAQARHDWLLHCSAALAHGFPQVPVFAAFRDEMHRLVELAADDMASRRFGRLTTALALVELNEDRGVFGPGPAPEAHVPQRVHRLLTPPDRLTRGPPAAADRRGGAGAGGAAAGRLRPRPARPGLTASAVLPRGSLREASMSGARSGR